MKRKLIVANWKSNKTEIEAKEWLSTISDIKNLDLKNKEIIVCPPFLCLSAMKKFIEEQGLPIGLGAQNISPFKKGAYTGEINGEQLKEFTDYVLIGHSERRISFGETDEMLFEKTKLAKESGLTVIYCAQGKETKIPENVDIIAYEPTSAIGTGIPDTPGSAEEVGAYFKANLKTSTMLYGGSSTAANVKSFIEMSNIDGVLIGGASLDVQEFIEVIKNA